MFALYVRRRCARFIFWRKTKIVAFGFCSLLIFALYFWLKRDFDIPLNTSLLPLGGLTIEQFPTGGESRVPRIIHQTWKDNNVPQHLTSYIQSIVRNHPTWEYWLWTDESARRLIKDKYPSFLSVFDGYPGGIQRADALRYFVLYEYGGVYFDMDIESLRSVEPLTRKYSCFLGQEPYIHPVVDTNTEHLVINAVMGCQKRHPFFKSVIDYLPKFAHMWSFLDRTGPHFMTFVYLSYNKIDPEDDGGVYLTPPEYFFPIIDPKKIPTIMKLCRNFENLQVLQKRACISVKTTGLEGRTVDSSFGVHHWAETYVSFIHKYIDIHKIVQNVKVYDGQS